MNLLGETSGSARNSIVDFAAALGFARHRGDTGVVLGVENDALHGFDRIDREGTIRGLVGKHDGVGTLDDSGGDVGDFGAGRLGIIYHG